MHGYIILIDFSKPQPKLESLDDTEDMDSKTWGEEEMNKLYFDAGELEDAKWRDEIEGGDHHEEEEEAGLPTF